VVIHPLLQQLIDDAIWVVDAFHFAGHTVRGRLKRRDPEP
jgi:hypothetical protein